MSLATLFAARVFTGGGLERTVRVFLTANGLLLPFIALQMYFHPPDLGRGAVGGDVSGIHVGARGSVPPRNDDGS